MSALQFSPESQVIFGYGVAYPFGLMGVILFISIAMQVLRGRIPRRPPVPGSTVSP